MSFKEIFSLSVWLSLDFWRVKAWKKAADPAAF
jgi:hypothetical protein